jgi:hypothetical protein
MRAVCVDQPISWLRLERYRLGELPEPERLAVEAHLAHCPACQDCYAETGPERELPPLPALSEVAGARSPRATRVAHGRRWFEWWLGWRGAALAAAAGALLLWVQGAPRTLDQARPRPAALSVKGGTLALQLVRQRGNAWSDRELGFRPGDRFKLLLTCPPGLGPAFAVVVYQDKRAYFPIALPETPAPGNLLPLPGAIALDGDTPATICVAWGGSDELAERRLARGSEMLPENAVCVQVIPEAAAK